MLLVICMILLCCNGLQLEIIDPVLEKNVIYEDGQLSEWYDAGIYEEDFSCSNGWLQIIEFEEAEGDELIVFKYSGAKFGRKDVDITVEPNTRPKPKIRSFNGVYKNFTLDAGCPSTITSRNYYNRVIITILHQYTFSFLLNCDHGDTHKQFQFGYLIITIFCTSIVVVASMHPKVYSIRAWNQPLSMGIRWEWFLGVSLGLIGCLAAVFAQKITRSELQNEVWTEAEMRLRMVNGFLRYFGLLISFAFCVICWKEVLYQWPKLTKSIPYCQHTLSIYPYFTVHMSTVWSFIFSFIFFLFGIWSQNWLYYNFLSACSCIGAIKLFRFRTLRNALITMTIVTITMLILLIWSHVLLVRSYNDYTSDLSTPLFIEVPDLVNNLYRKCSWIFILDVVLPGTVLAFLREYDENFHDGWKGVYTYTSIAAYAASMIMWDVVQATAFIYIPYCLIGYPVFLGSIVAVAHSRNEWKTLYYGYFHISVDSSTLRLIDLYKSGEMRWQTVMKQEQLDASKIDSSSLSSLSGLSKKSSKQE